MIRLQSQRNPYIIGRPINEEELFFGRREQLSFIDKNLKQGKKIILMHGQRRIGKSSLLHNIPQVLKRDKFVFVSFNLEYYSQEKLECLLENLAQTIVEQLGIDVTKVSIPTADQIYKQKDIFCNKFLPQIDEFLRGKNLVLLLDEFDALNNKYVGNTIESLFKQLKNVVERNKKLFAIIFAGRKPEDISNLKEIFKSVPIAEVGFLDDQSIKDLITKPAANDLKYQPEAIEAIIKLSAGHPYFAQVICFAIFSRARELEKWEVSEKDVEMIVDRAIELAEAGLAWYWDALSAPEKVVFSAVAEAQRLAIEKGEQHLKKDPLMLLKNSDILPQDVFIKIAKELVLKGFLTDKGNRVKIDLVCLWLLQRHPLWQEIRELEKQDKKEVDDNYVMLSRQKGEKPFQDGVLNWLKNLYESSFSSKILQDQNHREMGELLIVVIITTILGIGAIATFIALIHPRSSSNNLCPEPNGNPTNTYLKSTRC